MHVFPFCIQVFYIIFHICIEWFLNLLIYNVFTEFKMFWLIYIVFIWFWINVIVYNVLVDYRSMLWLDSVDHLCRTQFFRCQSWSLYYRADKSDKRGRLNLVQYFFSEDALYTTSSCTQNHSWHFISWRHGINRMMSEEMVKIIIWLDVFK